MSDDRWFAVVAEPELIDPVDDLALLAAAPPRFAISCDGVSKWFGGFQALDAISLDVDFGEVVTIIGRSGSGKTTFLRCLNRLEHHDAGTIEILGMGDADADAFDTRLLRERVGMVFQDFNLFPMMTVEQNVTIALRLVHGWAADRAKEQTSVMLERVGMARHARKRPSQLSGGEQQRVAIARTLATEPPIILLDEPTASIDPELTKGLMELIAEIAAGDVTIVIVSHEMSFARAAADRILFFEQGRLLEQGTPDQIFLDPACVETQRFIADARLLMA